MALKLEKMTVKELDAVIAQAQQRKQMAYEAVRQQARGRIDAILAETGLTLEELYSNGAGHKAAKRTLATKSKKPPRFRNPDNPEETWSGYGGRMPRWFANAINAGLTKEDLMIGSARKAPAAVKKARADVKVGRGSSKATKAPRRR